MYTKFILLMALLVLPPVMQAAGDAPLDRATLRGLGALGVIIDPIDPDLVKEGLTQDLVQKRIEERLRNAGITVDSAAPEFVGLRVLQVHAQKGSFVQRSPYALCVSVGVYQPVLLVRNKDLKTATETWAVETILMADPKVVSREALNSVDELADRLVAAYRTVNPRTSR